MIPFVGPSYQLKTKRQGVQRSVNLMPTPVEADGGKAPIYLKPVPGLVLFSGEDVPPDPGYSASTYYSTGDSGENWHNGGDHTKIDNGTSCAAPGFYPATSPTYATMTMSLPSVFNLGSYFPGMFEEYGITEGVFYGDTSGRSVTIPIAAGGTFGFGPLVVVESHDELWFTGVGGMCLMGVYFPGANSELRDVYDSPNPAWQTYLQGTYWPSYPYDGEALGMYWRITNHFTADGDFIDSELVFVDKAEYLANLP